jgi:hypothetical protein
MCRCLECRNLASHAELRVAMETDPVGMAGDLGHAEVLLGTAPPPPVHFSLDFFKRRGYYLSNPLLWNAAPAVADGRGTKRRLAPGPEGEEGSAVAAVRRVYSRAFNDRVAAKVAATLVLAAQGAAGAGMVLVVPRYELEDLHTAHGPSILSYPILLTPCPCPRPGHALRRPRGGGEGGSVRVRACRVVYGRRRGFRHRCAL